MIIRTPKRNLRLHSLEELGESALVCRTFHASRIRFDWHFHEALELCVIEGGKGIRAMGDSTELFRSPEVCLVGAGLPHAWMSDKGPLEIRVVQCRVNALGSLLEKSGEFKKIAGLIRKARRGLVFSGGAATEAVSQIGKVIEAPENSVRRILLFLGLLGTLADTPRVRTVASPAYEPSSASDHSKIRSVMDLIHRSEDPNRKTLAARLEVAEGTFSRWFKSKIGKTYVDYLKDLRLSRARKLLEETDGNIVEVALESGFRNLSNFNRQFKKKTGLSPKDYRSKRP